MSRAGVMAALLLAGATAVAAAAERTGAERAALAAALVFHASFDRGADADFDRGADADFARGDGRVFTAGERARRDAAVPGLPAAAVARVVPDGGRFGGALEFGPPTKQQVFYRGGANLGLAGAPENWAGSVALWLRLDPDRDLAPGYCDPFQLVGPKWTDGAVFIEFTKDHTPRHFRAGIFPVTKFWNPQNKKLEEMTDAERPMVPVRRPIFGRERWTHIVMTFAGLNSGRPDGRATLYVDGERSGTSEGWNHVFAWPDPAQTALTLGLNYTGRIDDVAVFDRELAAGEVRALFALPQGVAELRFARP